MKISSLSAALAATTCIVAVATTAQARQASFGAPAASLKGALDLNGGQSDRLITYKADEVRETSSFGLRGNAFAHEPLQGVLSKTGVSEQAGVSGIVATVRLASGESGSEAGTSADNADAQAVEQTENASSQGLADIVVTAQRTSQILQKIPVAAIAIDNKELERAGIQKFSDLQNNTPSLSISEGPGGRFINMRGVGIGTFTPQETAGVPISIDGFVIPRQFALDDAFLDLERVEVLRGPQGTFVGQNSTGGAVFLVTNKPNLDGVSGDLRQTVGNYGWYQTQGYVNTPISSTVGIRTALNFERRNSFATNRGNGDPTAVERDRTTPGNKNSQSVRVEALFKPSDDLRFVLSHSYSQMNNDGDDYVRGLPDGSITAPRDLYRDFPTSYNLKLFRTIGLIDWDISDSLRLHSMTGYMQLDNTENTDADGTSPLVDPFAAQSAYKNLFQQTIFNQEVTLASAGSGPFQWVVGANYLADIHPFAGDFLNYDTNYTMPNNGGHGAQRVEHYSYAVFGEGTFNFSPQWQLIIGGRYSWDDSTLADDTSFTPLIAPGVYGPKIDQQGKAKFSAPTGRIALNWFPDDDTLVYLTISRGYKAGAVTPRNGDGSQPPPLKSEFIINYEAGLKTALFDRHLRGAINAFYMDYKDYHANIRTPGFNGASSQNIAKARTYGLEAQLSALIGDLRVNLTGAYLNTRMNSQLIVVPPEIYGPGNPPLNSQLTLDLGGVPLNFAPKYTASANAEYEFRFGEATLTPRVQYSYISTQFYEFYQAPLDRIPGRGVVDFRLTYEAPEHWRVEGFVTNATDKTYVSGVVSGNPLTPWVGRVGFGAPRQFGVRLGYSF